MLGLNMMYSIQWLIQNIFYPYPELSILLLGGVSLILGYFVFRSLIYWIKFAKSKRKTARQIQQYLHK